MKYKVGDYVKIRQWDDLEKCFGLDKDGSIDLPSLMVEGYKVYCGFIGKVTQVDGEVLHIDLGLDRVCLTKYDVVPEKNPAEHSKSNEVTQFSNLEIIQSLLTPDQFRGYLVGGYIDNKLKGNREMAQNFAFWLDMNNDGIPIAATDYPLEDFKFPGL